MRNEQKIVRKLFKKLVGSSVQLFPEPQERLNAPNRQGVYVIYKPNKIVVHVGRTLRGQRGIAQRLKDHMYGRSSFTVQFLKKRGDLLRGKYRFQFIEIPNERLRAYVEAYAVGCLCPKHIGLGLEVKRRKPVKV